MGIVSHRRRGYQTSTDLDLGESNDEDSESKAAGVSDEHRLGSGGVHDEII